MKWTSQGSMGFLPACLSAADEFTFCSQLLYLPPTPPQLPLGGPPELQFVKSLGVLKVKQSAREAQRASLQS